MKEGFSSKSESQEEGGHSREGGEEALPEIPVFPDSDSRDDDLPEIVLEEDSVDNGWQTIFDEASSLEELCDRLDQVESVVLADGRDISGLEASSLIRQGRLDVFPPEIADRLTAIGRLSAEAEVDVRQEDTFNKKSEPTWQIGDRFKSRRTGHEFEIIDLQFDPSDSDDGFATLKFANPDPERFGSRKIVTEQVPFSKLNRLIGDIEPLRLAGRDLNRSREPEPESNQPTVERPVVSSRPDGWWGRVKGWFKRG